MEDCETKFTSLYQMANDFVSTATSYAKIIISELTVPAKDKLIKPLNSSVVRTEIDELGESEDDSKQWKGAVGLAGGEKYIVQNILFKLCLDFRLKENLFMVCCRVKFES
jgi:hypothetical protein